MAYCKFCGAQIPEGAAFCTSCGSPLKAAASASAQAPQQSQAYQPQPAPQSPFAPAQRTADRVFPSQQRAAAQQFSAAPPNAAPHPSQRFGAEQPAFGAGRQDNGIDWEHFQPRSSPKSANRLIFAASVLIFAVIVMIWTLLIQ